jgi:DNA-binding CsgD family transcriptional regulator
MTPVALSVFEEQVYRSAQSGATPEQIASLWGTDVESVRAALERAVQAREHPSDDGSEPVDD